MNDFTLLIDLHINNDRQGPGGETETLKAVDLANLTSAKTQLEIADIGCGSGASTIALAKKLSAQISAVDLFPEFLTKLDERAQSEGVASKIATVNCSMDSLPFEKEKFDIIWSEGAIYNIGFESGVRYLRQFVKPKGLLIVSEITWTTNERPKEIEDHWNNEYGEIGTAASKFTALETHGFSPRGYFVLPKYCWLENYYNPIESQLEDFLTRHERSEQAIEIVQAERKEIELYRKYSDFYSYGFYIAQKD